MLTLNDGRSELWQWDTGRTLAVDADCSQVHFSNKFFGRSIDVDVVECTAIIPDILLQTDKDLNVWAFVGTAESGYTKISKTFKVNRRNKPADYVFTPTEQTTIAEIAAIAQSVRDDADAGLFGGVQPDWNQNDSTAADYVKNRPFYMGDPVETVLVEESTATFADEGGVYGAEVISTFLATVGETYKVSWDGTVYESVCADYRAGLFAIGNLSIAGAGADTGEPFIIVPNGSSIFIYTPDTSDTHTFSISGLATEVVKIPDKYVSDTFRDIVTAGDPLQWSKDDWAAYYGLFQGGKLLKIKAPGGSMIESYVLSMFYNAGVGTTQITTITTEGNLYYLSTNPYTNKCYWSPVFEYGNLYLRYIQTGSNITPVNREEYDRLDVSGSLKFTTKKANEDKFSRKVVLEGDKEIVLSSYTANSTKKFKITVDDSGTISATEVI